MHYKEAAGFGDVVGWITDTAKKFADATLWVQGLVTTGMIGAGAAIGYGTAKMVSPTIITKNSDKELELEAVNTEIDVTQRRLAALEARKKRKSAAPTTQPKIYDRFV